MKTITIDIPTDSRRNFHGRPPINIRVQDDAIIDRPAPRIADLAVPISSMGDDLVRVRVHLSASQVTRIKRHFCPSRSHGCTCYSGPAIDMDDYGNVGGTILWERI